MTAGLSSRLGANTHSSVSPVSLECHLTFLQSQAIADSLVVHTWLVFAGAPPLALLYGGKACQPQSTLRNLAAYLSDKVIYNTGH